MRTYDLVIQHILYGYHALKLPCSILRFGGIENVKGEMIEKDRERIDIEAVVLDNYEVTIDSTLDKNKGYVRVITDFDLIEDDSKREIVGDHVIYNDSYFKVVRVNKYKQYGGFVDAIAERITRGYHDL